MSLGLLYSVLVGESMGHAGDPPPPTGKGTSRSACASRGETRHSLQLNTERSGTTQKVQFHVRLLPTKVQMELTPSDGLH